MNNLTDSQKGFFAIAACALLWSTAGIFIKLVTLPPMAIAGTRSAIAAITLWIFLKKPKFTFSFAQIAAAASNAATMLLFVVSNKLTTAANAILLQYSAPIFVAFLGWFILKELPSIDNWIALAFTIFGMAMFFIDKLQGFHMLGDTLSIVSGFTFGLTSIFMRMQKNDSPLESMLLAHIITACIGLPFLAGGHLPSITECGALLWLGIIQVGAASIFFAYAIKRITAVQTMLTAVLEPIFNPVWVFIFAGERPGFWSLIGGAIIIVSVTASSIISARRINNQR